MIIPGDVKGIGKAKIRRIIKVAKMEADNIDDQSNDLFSDSDTDYANIEADIKKKKRKIVASPRISRQLKKIGSNCEFEPKSSPAKSPRSLKQQMSQNFSPGKKKMSCIVIYYR